MRNGVITVQRWARLFEVSYALLKPHFKFFFIYLFFVQAVERKCRSVILTLCASKFPGSVEKKKMSPTVELIHKANLGCGEGPHWVEEEKALVFVDIPGPCVYRYEEATGKVSKATIGTISIIFILEFDLKIEELNEEKKTSTN